MISVTSFFKVNIHGHKSRTPFVKITFKNINGVDYDMTSFLTAMGAITRKLSIQTGQFSPGAQTLELTDSELLGKMQLLFRKNLNINTFIGIEYDVELGFLNGATEDTIFFYSGKIFAQNHNLNNGRILISAKDRVKDINDFKAATMLDAQDVFEYDDATIDRRGFQQVVKYGTHELVTNFVDSRALNNRDKPFSATLCFPNNPDTVGGQSKRKGDGGAANRLKGRLWYCPFENDVRVFNYGVNDKLKVFYWDYRDGQRKWRAFLLSDFTGAKVSTDPSLQSGTNGFYFQIFNDVIPSLPTGDWDDYIDGTGTWASDNTDPAVCIESRTVLSDSNPARIIHDLLTGDEFINLDNAVDTGPIDISTTDFATIDDTYSFDRAFAFFDEDGGQINTSILEPTSLKKIIEEIAKTAGIFFFQSARKNVTDDRSIRLEINRTINPCDTTQVNPEFAGEFSNLDKITNYNLNITNDGLRDKIINTNFDPSTSTESQFEIRTAGTGTRSLQLGTNSNPIVYWYSSSSTAFAVASRLLARLSSPVEIMRVTVDASGIPVEVADLVKLHDKLNDRTVIAQIFETRLNLGNFSNNFTCRRYNLLYGPDPDNPFKLWAFVDCAFVDNDKIAGNGANASITTGTKDVTFGGGETIDTNGVKIGMDITINEQNFRVAAIVSTTALTTDANATATESSKAWSIGNSYHVF